MTSMLLAFASALSLAAAPAQSSAQPQLSTAQQTSLKCAITLSIGTELQRRGDPVAAGWPALGDRSREFFVRVMAQLMDDTGMTHDQVATLVRDQSKQLADKAIVSRAMPGCLTLMSDSGL